MKRLIFKTLLLVCLVCLAWLAGLVPAPPALAEQPFSARAVVEQDEVYVGEPLVLQIRVEGEDNPEAPDLAGLAGFEVEPLGGQQNSSSSVTIINGQVTRETNRGYVFSYRLTPNRAGTLTIPALAVSAGGRTALTEPVTIRARQPRESDDFKLRLELSADTAYVGQPVVLTVTWYINQDVEGFQFDLPVLDDSRFDHVAADMHPVAGQEDLFLRLPLGKGEFVAKKERRELEGREYMTLRFRLLLIPGEAGSFTIPRATVVGNVVTGYQRNRQQSPFNDPFFDNFFGRGQGRQAVVQKTVTSSNEPLLTVRPLPVQGRPAGFNGLVGQYSLAATAAPTTVSVGEPITLRIMVTGPEYLDNVVLPDLATREDLSRAFKIPAEMAPGQVTERVKTFTQTIRAKNDGIAAIPGIELPYFDPEKGAYAVARSEPIPLTVQPTRVVTALDAEGRVQGEAPVKSELESRAEGIAYNYEDPGVLENRPPVTDLGVNLASPFWLLLLAGPPLAYFVLLTGVVAMRRRRADPEATRARRSFGELLKVLNRLEKKGLEKGEPGEKEDPARLREAILEPFRRYLGARLRLAPGALTGREIGERLAAAGVTAATAAATVDFIEACEAGRYAGRNDTCAGGEGLVSKARQLARNLEKELS